MTCFRSGRVHLVASLFIVFSKRVNNSPLLLQTLSTTIFFTSPLKYASPTKALLTEKTFLSNMMASKDDLKVSATGIGFSSFH